MDISEKLSTVAHSHDDDKVIIDAGYQPKLRRSLGFFSSFAISFSYMSVLTGIFANYGFLLNKSGPFGCWTWILVALGHTLTALVFAEMAGRMPLTGCGYNWNNKLASPSIGWFAGWMSLCAYAIGVAAVTATIFAIFRSVWGFASDFNTVRSIGIVLILLQALINIYGVRAAAYINLLAVAAEIVALIVFGLLIAVVVTIKGQANFALLSTLPSQPQPYWPAFLISCLLGSWTLLGFEGSADISEETINVRRVAPKSIIHSVLTCSILGFAFLVLITIAMPNPSIFISAIDPVSAIIANTLGKSMSNIFLALVFVSVFACALVNMTGASRVLFAMARDGNFIASKHLQKVSSHHVPAAAVWAVAVIASFFFWIADSATALYGAGAVLFALFYLTTVLSFSLGVKKLPPTDGFSLGLWHYPVVILASVWLIAEICILTIPKEFNSVAMATAGVLCVGLLLYFFTVKQLRK